MGNDINFQNNNEDNKSPPKFIISNNKYSAQTKEDKNEFIKKRKRFADLVYNQIFKSKTLEVQTNELFFLNRFKPKVTDNNKNFQLLVEKISNNSYTINKRKSSSKKDIEKRSFSPSSNLGSTSFNKENIIDDYNCVYRNKYYQKLLLKNMMSKKKQEKLSQNIFVFDWDDTIMCTSYITPTGYFSEKQIVEVNVKKESELIKNLEQLIIKILSFAISHGDTYIITNAASGWVEYSCKLFFPLVISLLSKITIISSRSWFEKEFPRNSKMWKLSCFEEIGKIQSRNVATNLIVIGDSLIEMEAAYHLAKNFDLCYIKTIKLKETPSPEQLFKQLNILYKDLEKIIENQCSLAISIQKEKKKNQYSRTNRSLNPELKTNRFSEVKSRILGKTAQKNITNRPSI